MEVERLIVRVVADTTQYLTSIAAVQARLVAFATTATTLVITHAMKMAGELEQVSIAFEVMTGSAEKAGQMIKSLQNFGLATPFSQREVIKQGQALAAYGVQVDAILPSLKALGELTAAAGGGTDRFQRLAYAYGEVLNNQRIFSTEMRQFASAGVNMWQAVADVLGVSVKEVRAMAKDGELGADVMVQALNKITSDGGRAYGLMSRQSDTFLGKMNTFTESIGLGLTKMGQGINSQLMGAGFWNIMQGGAKEFMESGEGFGKRIGQFMTDALAQLPAIVSSFKSIKDIISEIGTGMGTVVFEGMTLAEVFLSLPAALNDAFHSLRAGLYGGMGGLLQTLGLAANSDKVKRPGYMTDSLDMVAQGFLDQAKEDAKKGMGGPDSAMGKYLRNLDEMKKKMEQLKNGANDAKASLDKIGQIPFTTRLFNADITRWFDQVRKDAGKMGFAGGGEAGFEQLTNRMRALGDAAQYSDLQLRKVYDYYQRNPNSIFAQLRDTAATLQFMANGGQIDRSLVAPRPDMALMKGRAAEIAAGSLLADLRKGALPFSALAGAGHERGSTGAMDTVNASATRQLTILEEMRMLLEQRRKTQEDQLQVERDALAAIRELGKAPGLVSGDM